LIIFFFCVKRLVLTTLFIKHLLHKPYIYTHNNLKAATGYVSQHQD
jgi:hypothetical protein